MVAPTTLVTGAAGVTGRALCMALRAQGDTVVEVDRAEGDLTDPAVVDTLLARVLPDRVAHLAGTFSNRFDVDHPSNVLATRHLLEAVKTHVPACRVLLVGSAAEYGAVPLAENPVREDRPLRPVSVYGLTKSMQTSLAAYYARTQGAHVVVARTFNLVGKGLSPALLPGRLETEIARLLRGEIDHIQLRSLEGRRDFLPVERAALEYALLLDHGAAGEVYHVASGVPVHLRAFVAEQLARAGLDLAVVREGQADSTARATQDIWADVGKLRALAAC